MQTEHLDVLIIGAGLSGIGAAHHLQHACPQKSYAILEGRGAIGGTWDLFRYPGIRSDSDMFTMGYSFRPWSGSKALADGQSILEYIRDTAREAGIDRHIRFHRWVQRATWSSRDARWTVEVERRDGPSGTLARTERYTCGFLVACSGYYSYAGGYTPSFPGAPRYAGRLVHPQKWPADLDYAGKRVVVIGSGATAVTLVPALAATAAHVTMLQRSPTYIVSRPAEDQIANWLRRHLPASWAYGVARWKNVLLGTLFYEVSRRRPELAKKLIRKGVEQQLGTDPGVARHFTPAYNPWDQRLCLVPDADLFRVVKQGRARVVTDQIETFTETGIRLKSGQELPADIVVTATGLVLELMGGVELQVDGRPVDFARALCYKGMMYSDVPNFVACLGYTNASWTLRADLTCGYLCRLLNFMDRKGYTQVTPRNREPDMPTAPCIDLSSGYVQRAVDRLPRQGSRAPWRVHQSYPLDLLHMKLDPVEDAALEFIGPQKERREAVHGAPAAGPASG
jgi:cation diffusion facilitator CzcD-associated flavoprotein CzcO